MMTATKMKYQIIGTAWPGHISKPLAIAMHKYYYNPLKYKT